jgi:phage terminase large subunit
MTPDAAQVTAGLSEEHVLPYRPLPWQEPALYDKSSILLLTGSAGGGKSRCAAEKVNAFLKFYPRAMGLVVRKTRESMTNSTVLFLARGVIGQDSSIRHLKADHRFEYDNESILAYGGMKDEEQREQIRSIGQEGGLDIVWIEEANKLTEADFNELLARMRGRAAGWTQIILSCNPDAPSHWIKTRLIDGGEAKVYYSGAKDNPYNPPSYVETLNSLTGVQHQRLNLGMWVQAEGVVYDDYNPAIHLIEPFDVPSEWTRYRLVDFGYTNPLCIQWWARDGDGRLYRYRELYKTKLLVEDAAEVIAQAETITPADEEQGISAEMERISECICDHDAEDRATLEKHLRRLGCTASYTKAADKRIKAGIQHVQLRLREAGDGKARLFFMRGALMHPPDKSLREAGRPVCSEEEISSYIWPKDQVGKPQKEEPVDEDNHGMDCMRYMVMRLDGRKAAQVLFI